MTCHLVLPAAGAGRRFGSEQPKQYAEAFGKSIMEWTLEAFNALNFIDRIVLVIAENDTQGTSIASRYPRVETVSGGGERFESVLNGLLHLEQECSDSDWVMVHDIARPCVRTQDVERLYEKCQQTGHGAVLANQVTDTTKRRLSDSRVETIDRSTLWSVQTPQCFRLRELIDALAHCGESGLIVTDEASAVEQYGGKVGLVPGSKRNIKLTHADDLPLIEFFLNSKET